MRSIHPWLLICLVLLTSAGLAPAEDWPQWRGPRGDNKAPGASAPTTWSRTEGLAWATPLPGRGHSSPVVVGDRIYLTTADEEAGTQSLLVLDRATGTLVKQTVVHTGGLNAPLHPNNTHATPTVAADGEHVAVVFNNDFGVWATVFDSAGKQLWQRRIAGFDPQQYKFGFGSSPRIHSGVLVISTEYDGPDSGVYGVDVESGRQIWKAERPHTLSYSTPISTEISGVSQLFMSGNNSLTSYSPETGETLWSTPGTSRATCGTMVWDYDSGLAFASGGYPDQFTLAVRTSGDHAIVWQNRAKCYEQSMLAVGGYLYAVADSGIAYCWRGVDGKEMWQERLGGKCSSSPLLVGDTIYITTEQGLTHVFKASPKRLETIASNQLGDDCFATPAPVDGRLLYRFGVNEAGKRQEYLAAVGK